MEQSSSRVVAVEIHGHQYSIRSALDPAYVAELASYVDAKMRQAHREAPASDALRLAILAAINIADECYRTRDEGRQRDTAVAARAGELETLLDRVLGLQEPRAAVR